MLRLEHFADCSRTRRRGVCAAFSDTNSLPPSFVYQAEHGKRFAVDDVEIPSMLRRREGAKFNPRQDAPPQLIIFAVSHARSLYGGKAYAGTCDDFPLNKCPAAELR